MYVGSSVRCSDFHTALENKIVNINYYTTTDMVVYIVNDLLVVYIQHSNSHKIIIIKILSTDCRVVTEICMR